MELKVELNDEDVARLRDEAKEDVRQEITEEKLREYLRTLPHISVVGVLKLLGTSDRYASIEAKPLKDLSREEKQLAILYWQLYERFY